MKASKTNSGSAALPPDMPPVDERSRREMMRPAPAHAGRFQKGQSGNPQGRPPGSRNKNTVLMQEMMDEEAPNIVRTAIDMAIAGNPRMVKLCVERLMPALKERPVPLHLPKVERSQDVLAASSAIWAAVAEALSAWWRPGCTSKSWRPTKKRLRRPSAGPAWTRWRATRIGSFPREQIGRSVANPFLASEPFCLRARG